MTNLYKYLALVTAFIFVAFIKSSPLETNIAFILAALIIFAIIYIVIQRRNKSFNLLFSGRAPEIFFVSAIVLFMIELTGGVASQLYFLSYFLLFGLPLISTPLMSLIFTLSMIGFYVPELIRGEGADIFIKIGSILLLLPISYFLSKELEKRQIEKAILKQKAQKIEEEAEELETNENDINDREKLDEIIESAQELEES